MTWWEKKKKSFRGLGYYRHSAEGRQENSIEIQRDAVHAWAERNNVAIVDEYIDAGKSGTSVDGRDGFLAFIERVKQRDVDYVICNDATRWGRFQNISESAAYENECSKYGAEVKYVVHGDLPRTDEYGDSFQDIQKALEQKMAGKFSADLSKKVLAGAKKVSWQGNRAGGPAPYGTVRLEVNERREPVGIMKPKQHKSYPNNRVKLTPDEEGNAPVIRNIFDLFVSTGHVEKQIAAFLNERDIPAPRGGKWRAEGIRHVLQNEQYAGSVVYNKTSSKLGTKEIKRNPPKDWIVVPGSFEPVVEWAVFEKARDKFILRNKRMSREEILEKIRSVFKEFGMLSHSLLSALPEMPTKREITLEFGSLPEAFQSLYPDVTEKTQKDVQNMIKAEANDVLDCEDFLVINKMFSVKIVPVLPFPRGYGHQWYFRIDQSPNVDITLGVPLRDCQGSQILGYFPFLRVLTDEPLICIADSSSFKIGLFGHLDLRFIFDLIHWTNPNSKETKK